MPHLFSDAPAPRPGLKQWAGLALLVLPMLMVASDLTVLFLALPTLSVDLEPSASEGLWITHIYGFVIASLLVTAGRVGDWIGPRRLLLIGAAVFGVLSAVAAYSVNPEMLIGTRALLGAAGATLMPSLFSLLRTMFVDETQRRLAQWLLPQRAERNAARIDLPSLLLSVAGILAVIYGLQELAAGQESGEGSAWPNLAIAFAGVVVLGLFIRRQHRLAEPLFDLSSVAHS